MSRLYLHRLHCLALLLKMLSHVLLVVDWDSEIALCVDEEHLDIIAPSWRIGERLVHTLSVPADKRIKVSLELLGINRLHKGLANKAFPWVVGRAAVILGEVKGDGHAVHVAKLIDLVGHALPLGEGKGGHVDEVRDAAVKALGGSCGGAQAVQGVCADLASVAVHQHGYISASLYETGGVGPDLIRVGCQVGIWGAAPVGGGVAWDVHLKAGTAQRGCKLRVAGRDMPAAMDEEKSWFAGS